MVCIVLDGSRLTPAVVIKNVTVYSLLFEKGYDSDNVVLYTTKNSFVTGDVFWKWLCDVFIPYVEAKREALRQRLGTFYERAVLILDGCSSHKKRSTAFSSSPKTSPCCFWSLTRPTSPSPPSW